MCSKALHLGAMDYEGGPTPRNKEEIAMSSNLFSLDGKVALVTGGSRGIGKMIAKGYLEAGAAKVYISSRKAPACIETAEELGPQCIALPQDVSTLDGIKALTAAYLAKEDRLDILLNNAGAAWGADFDEFPESGWDKVVDLNLKSPFFLTQALHGALAKAGTHARPSKVINIASIDGIRLNPQETYSYHASKAGLIYLTRRMAARLILDNIVVSAIAPGAFMLGLGVLMLCLSGTFVAIGRLNEWLRREARVSQRICLHGCFNLPPFCLPACQIKSNLFFSYWM